MTTAQTYMSKAVELASSVFSTSPNPRVGCIIVQNDQIIAEGWHAKAGQPHAEIDALRKAGDKARGATVYVTLEPCCHHGRTGPCCEALIEAGVAEVVFAMTDPNPRVAGKGLEKLTQAGIRISGPILEEEARALNPGYIKRMTLGFPYVRCKMAMSLDGRTAMASGESQWITGPKARADVQKLRAASCAIVTGVNTVLSDNPSLNVRTDHLEESDAQEIRRRQPDLRQPRRVVLDSSLRTPPESKLIELEGEVVFLVGSPHKQQLERFSSKNVVIRQVDTQRGGRLNLVEAMRCLARDFSCNEVLLEAGPTLSGAMVQAGLVDEVVIYIGPKFLGSDALPLFNLPGLKHIEDHIALEIAELRRIADDCRITARLIDQRMGDRSAARQHDNDGPESVE